MTSSDFPITYSLAADTSGGGFKIDATTGVVSVADPSQDQLRDRGGSRLHHHRAIRATASSPPRRASPSMSPTSRRRRRSTAIGARQHRGGRCGRQHAGRHHRVLDRRQRPRRHSLEPDATTPTAPSQIDADHRRGHRSPIPPRSISKAPRPGTSYNITAVASDGTLTSSQNFAINVSDVALTTPVDGNAAANSVVGRRRQRLARSASPRSRPIRTGRRRPIR